MAGTPSDSTGDATSLPTSPLKVENMWGSNAYNIGGKNFLVCARHQFDPNIFASISWCSCDLGHVYTLDDIEHGVLRGNKGHPSKKGQPQFDQKDDPRYVKF